MIVKILLPLILAFIMFSLGLGLRGSDFTRILKFPKAFAMGMVCQVIILPLVGFAITLGFQLKSEIAVGMMILALCPGGVTTNVLTRIANGNVPLSISLTAVTSLLSTLTVPILVALSFGYFMGAEAQSVDVTKLGIQMFLITTVPVLFGMGVTKWAPGFVDKAADFFARVAVGLFVLILIAAIVKNWQVIQDNIAALGPALVLLNVILLFIGLFGSQAMGLTARDASTIAIEGGIQNGTLGIAVGGLVMASAAELLPPTTVPSAVYGMTMYLVSLPFVLWRKQVNAKLEH